MFSLTSRQVIFYRKIGFYFPEITLTTEFPGSNFLLSTFSIGSKQAFPVANYLPLASVNFGKSEILEISLGTCKVEDLMRFFKMAITIPCFNSVQPYLGIPQDTVPTYLEISQYVWPMSKNVNLSFA